MSRTIDTYALPLQVEPEELAGATVVVIDVIRASTTILHTLAAGAVEVRPFLEVEDAREAAKAMDSQQGRASYLLGGERDAVVIEGFDLGNSPRDYTPERVVGRTLLFTTTNGTRAMMRCKAADQVLIGAFVNAAAIVERLLQRDKIILLCAGTAGEESGDDLLLAGLLTDRLQQESEEGFLLNNRSQEVQASWKAIADDATSPERLAEHLAKTRGGQNVVRAGLTADLLDVGTVDRFSLVPELNTDTMRIRINEPTQ